MESSGNGVEKHLCADCGRPISGAEYSGGDGNWLHPYCFLKKERLFVAADLRQVLGNPYDPGLGISVVEAYMDPKTVQRVVKAFNRRFRNVLRRRLKTARQEYEEEFGPLKEPIAEASDLKQLHRAEVAAKRRLEGHQ